MLLNSQNLKSATEFNWKEILILSIFVIIVLFVQIWISFLSKKIHDYTESHKKTRAKKKTIQQVNYFINNLVSSLAKLSYDKVGGLIILENHNNMQRYIRGGREVNIDFSPEFVYNVFYNHDSPLHDGAMIIRDLKIVSLSSYVKVTKRTVDVKFGARHRAAIGVCEEFDCFCFVVSEVRGTITFIHRGTIRELSTDSAELVGQITHILLNNSVYQDLIKK